MDNFWTAIDAQLDQIESDKPSTYAAIEAILGKGDSGTAFFAGSGGDRTLYGALRVAGWRQTWVEADYYYVAQHLGTGNVITYIEGDVYPHDIAIRT